MNILKELAITTFSVTGTSTFLQTFGAHLQNYIMSQASRLQSQYLQPQKPQILYQWKFASRQLILNKFKVFWTNVN
jgi:hypothetical protein